MKPRNHKKTRRYTIKILSELTMVKCDNPLCDYDRELDSPEDRTKYLQAHRDERCPQCGAILIQGDDPFTKIGDLAKIPVTINVGETSYIQILTHHTHPFVVLPFITDKMRRLRPLRSFQGMPCPACYGTLNYYNLGKYKGTPYAIYVCDHCYLNFTEIQLYHTLEVLAEHDKNPKSPIVAWLKLHPVHLDSPNMGKSQSEGNPNVTQKA